MEVVRNRGDAGLTRAALDLSQMQRIAEELAAGGVPHKPLYKQTLTIHYSGKVVAKERPRMAGGRTYTPPKTVAFERSVAVAGRAAMEQAKLSRFAHPIIAHLRIMEATPQSWGVVDKALAMAGVICPSQNDMDNQIKAIFDGLNGVVYKDDSQLTQLFAIREYGPAAGFVLNISPAGVTAAEVETIKKFYATAVRRRNDAKRKEARQT